MSNYDCECGYGALCERLRESGACDLHPPPRPIPRYGIDKPWATSPDCPIGKVGDLAGNAQYENRWCEAAVLRQVYEWACAEAGWDVPFGRSAGTVFLLLERA